MPQGKRGFTADSNTPCTADPFFARRLRDSGPAPPSRAKFQRQRPDGKTWRPICVGIDVMSRHWQCMAQPAVVILLVCSMVGCAHRRGLSSPRSIGAPGSGPASASPPSGRRAQEAVDEVLNRLKQSERPRPASAAGPVPGTGLNAAEPQQPIGTSGTLPPAAYSVVIVTQPSPAAEVAASAGPPVETNRSSAFERGGRRLGPPAAALIALSLIAAIVWLPRLRDRRSSIPPQAG